MWGMGRAGEGKRERKRKGLIKYSFSFDHSNSNTILYCTIIRNFAQVSKGAGGEGPGSRGQGGKGYYKGEGGLNLRRHSEHCLQGADLFYNILFSPNGDKGHHIL